MSKARDWTANSAVTMTAEVTAYRQALRDVPAQAGSQLTLHGRRSHNNNHL